MLMIVFMSFLTMVLCVAFFCELNGGICGKTWDRLKERFNAKADDWSEMYNDGN